MARSGFGAYFKVNGVATPVVPLAAAATKLWTSIYVCPRYRPDWHAEDRSRYAKVGGLA
jgi:hypothetical protein